MSEQRCWNCRYWDAPGFRDDTLWHVTEDCRRHAPVSYQQEHTHIQTGFSSGRWPITKGDESCGDWEEVDH